MMRDGRVEKASDKAKMMKNGQEKGDNRRNRLSSRQTSGKGDLRTTQITSVPERSNTDEVIGWASKRGHLARKGQRPWMKEGKAASQTEDREQTNSSIPDASRRKLETWEQTSQLCRIMTEHKGLMGLQTMEQSGSDEETGATPTAAGGWMH